MNSKGQPAFKHEVIRSDWRCQAVSRLSTSRVFQFWMVPASATPLEMVFLWPAHAERRARCSARRRCCSARSYVCAPLPPVSPSAGVCPGTSGRKTNDKRKRQGVYPCLCAENLLPVRSATASSAKPASRSSAAEGRMRCAVESAHSSASDARRGRTAKHSAAAAERRTCPAAEGER